MNISVELINNHKYYNHICICLLLMLALLVRVIFFSGGICGGDAFAYARHAYDIASGKYELNAIHGFYGFRYFVLLTTALSFAGFGVNDIAASFFPFIFALLNVLVVYFIAERTFNRTIALISSILLIFYPLDIIQANVVSPDSFIPLLSSLSILLYIIAEKKSSFVFPRNFLLSLSGALIAFAYMSRVTSIFLFFSLTIFQIYRKKYKYLLCSTLGLFIPLAVEALYFYIFTGDPFFEFHRITEPSIAYTVKNDYDLSLLYYPKIMFGYDLTGLAYFGLTWWLVVGGLILAWIKRDIKILFIAICLIIPFFGFEFGFQSLKEGILISKNYPYLSLITGPAMIIGAYFIYHIQAYLRIDIKLEQRILLFTLVLLASMNVYGTYRLYANLRDDVKPYKIVADFLKKRPNSTVYTHHFRWPLSLCYFLEYDPSYNFIDLNHIDKANVKKLSDAYVILNRRYIEADVIGRTLPLDSFVARYAKRPPQSWGKCLSYSGNPSYNSVDIYYVPKSTN